MNFKFYSDKQLSLLLHILAWSTVLILPRYIIHAYGDGNIGFLRQMYAETFFYGLFFYLNYLWLVPKFFVDKRKLIYFLFSIGIVVLFVWVMNYLNNHVFFDAEQAKEIDRIMDIINKGKEVKKPPFKQFKIYGYSYTLILIWGFSFGLGVMKKLAQNEKLRKELEKEKLNSELAMLKNQVSPHFFFNTLNNIYSLIGINVEKAQESVHKLSKLMRYLLYESENGESSVQDEINFMNNYIDLMKLRLNEKVKLEIDFPTDYSDSKIPPLLFIPFIENAFKHGISYREPSFIKICMQNNRDQITFLVENSKVMQSIDKEGIHSGIGLANVKKRLQLLYPNKHELNITDGNDVFSIHLILDVSK